MHLVDVMDDMATSMEGMASGVEGMEGMAGSMDEDNNSREPGGGAVKREKTAAEIRKSNKPLMERKRRERINNCLQQLKSILMEVTKKESSYYSKLEKADILEMTVKYLKNTKRQQLAVTMGTDPSMLGKYIAGYNECTTEISNYLNSVDGLPVDTRSRMLNHLANSLQRSSLSMVASSAVSNLQLSINQSCTATAAQPLGIQIPAATQLATLPGSAGICVLNQSPPQIQTIPAPPIQLVPAKLPSGDLIFILANNQQLVSPSGGGGGVSVVSTTQGNLNNNNLVSSNVQSGQCISIPSVQSGEFTSNVQSNEYLPTTGIQFTSTPSGQLSDHSSPRTTNSTVQTQFSFPDVSPLLTSHRGPESPSIGSSSLNTTSSTFSTSGSTPHTSANSSLSGINPHNSSGSIYHSTSVSTYHSSSATSTSDISPDGATSTSDMSPGGDIYVPERSRKHRLQTRGYRGTNLRPIIEHQSQLGHQIETPLRPVVDRPSLGRLQLSSPSTDTDSEEEDDIVNNNVLVREASVIRGPMWRPW